MAREPAGRGAEQVEDEEGIDGVRWPWRRFAGLLVPAAGTVLALAAAGSLPLSLARGGWAPAAGSVASAKSLFASVRDPSAGERTVYSVWDGFGRTDVTEPATTSDLKWVYVDGSVAGLMPRADSSTAAAALTADLAYLPFSLPGTRDKVLVIGAGGGQEIAMALAAGAREVVATEASPGVIRAGRRFAAFNGGVFDHPAVRVVNQDGRTYLRSADEQFDVIYVTLAASGVAQPAGTASGRYLYTLEAFGDYLDHLRQDGRLALKVRDEHELTRAFNTAFQALTRRGATPVQAIRRLLAVNDQPLAQRQGVAVALPVLTMRKTPYLEDEARAVFEALRQTPYTPLFVPFLEQLSPLGAFAVEEIGPAAIEAGAPYEIRPASDASPFFFYAGKGPPGLLVIAPVLVLAATGVVLLLARRPGVEAIDPDAAGGVPAEAAAFLEDEVPWRFVGFVALVAAGAELVQLPAIHRLGLLVGEPARSATVALAGLLLGGAAGSVLAQRVAPAALRPAIGWAALGTGLYAVGLLELLPMADVAAAGLAPAGRAAVAAGLIAPLGVGIGVPFPSAVRLLATARRGAWAALLWSVAALAGAVASFVALALGMAWSFTLATALGACCAFGAFMMAGLRLLAADDAAVETPSADGADTARFRRPAERPAAPPALDHAVRTED
jgi:SAM-dependent methyltransferase